MAVLSTTKMMARQFLQLGEDPPGVRLELVEGEVAVSPSPIPDHSYVVLTLSRILGSHIEEYDPGQFVGDVETIFDDHNVRRPNIIYFSRARLHLIGEKAIEGPPELCVEVLSPSSIEMDRVDKFELYQKHGVAHYWIVDVEERKLEGWRLEGGRYEATGAGRGEEVVKLPPFDDLEIPLGKLWRRK